MSDGYRYVMSNGPIQQHGVPDVEPEMRSVGRVLTLGEMRRAIAALADEPDDLPVHSSYYEVEGVGVGPAYRHPDVRAVDLWNSE